MKNLISAQLENNQDFKFKAIFRKLLRGNQVFSREIKISRLALEIKHFTESKSLLVGAVPCARPGIENGKPLGESPQIGMHKGQS